MPLDKDGALPPGEDMLRIVSAGDTAHTQPVKQERRRDTMPKQPLSNGHDNNSSNGRPRGRSEESQASNGPGLSALIAEAQSLKEALHDAHGRTARLVAALKRHKKQSRLMASTLNSLRQLQNLNPLDG
jgi:hypothetical protein